MDLLCTENIMNDYDHELLCHQQIQKQQKNHQQQQQHVITPRNATSPYSNLSSSSTSSSSSSSSSSGYNSTNSDNSNLSCSSCCSANCHLSTHRRGHHITEGSSACAADIVEENSLGVDIASHLPALYHQQEISNAYTKNLINRALDFVNTATEDPTFLTDRCLENALKAEEKRPHPVCTYFKTVQKDITPPMRKIVAEWMMEVCAEEKCQEEVVLLALNYMDRFLSSKSVRKTHLQILAAACLLLASKLREPSCRALSAELLVFYTDNSIYKGDLIKWELFVLSRLGWDLSSVTPLDFLELLLIRLPIRSNKCPELNVDKVRQHAQAFISLAAKEHYFSMYSASTIAASSIAAALSGLNWHLRTGQNLRYLLNILTDLTSVEQDYLHDCMIKMETIFEEHSRNLQPYLVSVEVQQKQQQQQIAHQHHQQQQQSQQQQAHLHHSHHNQQQQQQHQHHQNHHHNQNVTSRGTSVNNSSSSSNSIANTILPDLTQTCKMQANAQKEVQDIKF